MISSGSTLPSTAARSESFGSISIAGLAMIVPFGGESRVKRWYPKGLFNSEQQSRANVAVHTDGAYLIGSTGPKRLGAARGTAESLSEIPAIQLKSVVGFGRGTA